MFTDSFNVNRYSIVDVISNYFIMSSPVCVSGLGLVFVKLLNFLTYHRCYLDLGCLSIFVLSQGIRCVMDMK